MFRFSHTAMFEGQDQQNEIRAVFSVNRPGNALTTSFNFKTARAGQRRPGEMDMTLEQMDTWMAGVSGIASGHDIMGQLKLGRTAVVQRQRYEEHMLQPAAATTEAAVSNG